MAWQWQKALIKVTLFLRISKTDVAPVEWREWTTAWRSFADRIDRHHPRLTCFVAYAIGIARNDEDLMDIALESIGNGQASDDNLKGIIRDIDRGVIFMKAATSKNCTEPVIIRHLKSRGISAA